MADAGTWDEAKLMGIGDDSKGADKIKDDPMLWGVPGHLTKEEAETYVSCCRIVNGHLLWSWTLSNFLD